MCTSAAMSLMTVIAVLLGLLASVIKVCLEVRLIWHESYWNWVSTLVSSIAALIVIFFVRPYFSSVEIWGAQFKPIVYLVGVYIVTCATTQNRIATLLYDGMCIRVR